MKTRFDLSIIKPGEQTEYIVKAIASHNGGNVPLCREDFISWANFEAARREYLQNKFYIESTDEPGELRVTEDGGKTWTLIIQEVEFHELETTPETLAEIALTND